MMFDMLSRESSPRVDMTTWVDRVNSMQRNDRYQPSSPCEQYLSYSGPILTNYASLGKEFNVPHDVCNGFLKMNVFYFISWSQALEACDRRLNMTDVGSLISDFPTPVVESGDLKQSNDLHWSCIQLWYLSKYWWFAMRIVLQWKFFVIWSPSVAQGVRGSTYVFQFFFSHYQSHPWMWQ